MLGYTGLARLVLAIAGKVYLHLGRLGSGLFMSLIVGKSIEQTNGYRGLSFIAHHISLLGGIADEAHLGQHSRHGCFVEHEKLGLLDTTVEGLDIALVLVLGKLGKVQTLVQISILIHGKHHIALRRIGVETGILTVVLVAIGILLLGDLHVGTAARQTHHVCLHAVGHGGGVRIDMDGNEQVGLVAVGDIGTLGQSDINIGGAGIDNLDVRIVVADQLAKFLGYGKGKVFLLTMLTNGSRLVAAMTRVNDKGFHFSGLSFLRNTHPCYHEQRNKEY